jgi:hypothetical protein
VWRTGSLAATSGVKNFAEAHACLRSPVPADVGIVLATVFLVRRLAAFFPALAITLKSPTRRPHPDRLLALSRDPIVGQVSWRDPRPVSS